MLAATMRFLIFILGIALIVFTIYLSYASFVADTRHSTELTPLYPSPIFILNTSENSAPLFSSKTPHASAIGKLKPGEYYRFAYAGSSGTWLYGNRVFIKNEKRTKTILVGQKPIALEYLKMVYIIGVAVLFLMLATIVKKKMSNRQKHQLELNALASTVNQERQSRMGTESSLTDSNKLIKELNHTIQRQKLVLTSKDAEIERQKKRSLDEMMTQFKQKECQLKQQFEDDANLRAVRSKQQARVEVDQMQRSYDALNEKYLSVKSDFARIKSEGMTFDIDFDDKNYSILLKGRLYEICFAQKLLSDPNFEILTWTSDKGFQNGIRVKSNGDPDFLIRYKRKHTLAVECKYRSGFFKRKGPREISWCNSEQAVRYTQYQRDKNVPVFVAIGFEGDAKKPNQEFLVDLNQLINLSDDKHWNTDKTGKEQQVVLATKLKTHLIDKAQHYPAAICKLTNIEQENDTPKDCRSC